MIKFNVFLWWLVLFFNLIKTKIPGEEGLSEIALWARGYEVVIITSVDWYGNSQPCAQQILNSIGRRECWARMSIHDCVCDQMLSVPA